MTDFPSTPNKAAADSSAPEVSADPDAELLVEEVSIDGMCGVY